MEVTVTRFKVLRSNRLEGLKKTIKYGIIIRIASP
jgi:hypothetical protein